MARPRAFTLVELLVVVAVIALLMGALLPALAGANRAARAAASASNLRQMGVGLAQYLGDEDDRLPQVRVDGAGNPVTGSDGSNIGTLFGGKAGTLPFFGIDRIGARGRPLNAYVSEVVYPEDGTDGAEDVEVELFRDPEDRGMPGSPLASLGFDTSNLYDLLGTSYVLNDHALDEDPNEELYPTLIPREGGRKPRIANPTRTWLAGTQPIHNFDDGGDRGMRWGGADRVQATLLFADWHVEAQVSVPEGAVNETGDYTFLPDPAWLDRFRGAN